jgi:hypothetical protein
MKILSFLHFIFRRGLRKISQFIVSCLPQKELGKLMETMIDECIVRNKPLSFLSLDQLKDRGFLRLISLSNEPSQRMYFTCHLRPIFTEGIETLPDNFYTFSNIAIIIQGPIIKENDFTFESVRLYKKIFHKSKIILSTWNDEDRSYLEKFKNEDIFVVLNNKPTNSGISNVNYQVISSHSGIQKAQELDCLYSLKTRSDQRIYAPNTEAVLLSILKSFPLKQPSIHQVGRIVAISLNTYKYRLYSVSDMFLFGYTSDLDKFWNPPLDEREKVPLDWLKITENAEKSLFPEAYLVTNYLTKIGRTPAWTISDSWNVYSEIFCIVDKEIFDLYWPKYQKELEYREISYDFIRTNKLFNFADWLNFQSHTYQDEFTDEMRKISFPLGEIIDFSSKLD